MIWVLDTSGLVNNVFLATKDVPALPSESAMPVFPDSLRVLMEPGVLIP
jgi:hypothetical protein